MFPRRWGDEGDEETVVHTRQRFKLQRIEVDVVASGNASAVLVAQAILALAGRCPLLAQPELQVVADPELVHHDMTAHQAFICTVPTPHLDVADRVYRPRRGQLDEVSFVQQMVHAHLE